MTDLEFNQLQNEFLMAEKELGPETFTKHFHEVFGIPCLDFVNSIVINLPEPCYANCEYCIDTYLRKNLIDNTSFLEFVKKYCRNFQMQKVLQLQADHLIQSILTIC